MNLLHNAITNINDFIYQAYCGCTCYSGTDHTHKAIIGLLDEAPPCTGLGVLARGHTTRAEGVPSVSGRGHKDGFGINSVFQDNLVALGFL